MIAKTGNAVQKETVYENLDDFINGLKANGITKIAFAETAEKRAVQVELNAHHVTHVSKLDLIAYRNPVIHKYSADNPDFNSIFERLESEGFEIKRVSRNIT